MEKDHRLNRYVLRKIDVQAAQWEGFDDLPIGPHYEDSVSDTMYILRAGTGDVTVDIGDWIVLDNNIWLRLTDPEFRATYVV